MYEYYIKEGLSNFLKQKQSVHADALLAVQCSKYSVYDAFKLLLQIQTVASLITVKISIYALPVCRDIFNRKQY
jgi:hypothetical protein